MGSAIIAIATVIGVFSLIIAVHEFGHFLAAKLLGISVPVFSVGLGWKLCGIRLWNTDFRISVFPLGGYVKPVEEEMVAHPPWHRFLVAIAGPLASIMLGMFVFAGTLMTPHTEYGFLKKAPVVGFIEPGSAAEKAGLLPGDQILRINGNEMPTWEDAEMELRILTKSVKPVNLEILRNGINTTLTIQKVPTEEFFGIGPKDLEEKTRALSPGNALRESMKWGVNIFKLNGRVVGKAAHSDNGMAETISGPIGIMNIIAKISHLGLRPVCIVLALISFCLGVFNLLPILPLDGGLMLVAAMETVLGRNVNPKVLWMLQLAGIAFLAFVFYIGTKNDIRALLHK